MHLTIRSKSVFTHMFSYLDIYSILHKIVAARFGMSIGITADYLPGREAVYFKLLPGPDLFEYQIRAPGLVLPAFTTSIPDPDKYHENSTVVLETYDGENLDRKNESLYMWLQLVVIFEFARATKGEMTYSSNDAFVDPEQYRELTDLPRFIWTITSGYPWFARPYQFWIRWRSIPHRIRMMELVRRRMGIEHEND